MSIKASVKRFFALPRRATSASAAGQDGYRMAGVAWPETRFTNLDGTTPIDSNIVLDRLTGLKWPAFIDGTVTISKVR